MVDRSNRRWWALAALTLPVVLMSVDMTVMSMAVAELSEDLRPSPAQLLWIVDVYAFFLACLLVPMGTLGDRIGRRRLLVAGAVAFTVASVLAAFAPSAGLLIAARALQGVGAATLMPSTLSLIRAMFDDDRERRRAIAVWSAAFAGGAGLGPIAGGVLLQHFWWGSVFLINVPIMAVLLACVPVLVPESRDPHPGRFDPASPLLLIAAILAVVYAMKQTAEHGPTLTAAAALLAGLAVGVAFVDRQRRLTDPMLDVRLFTNRRFAISVVTNMFGIFALVGLLFFLPQYLQLVAGLGPLSTGLWALPAALGAIAGSLAAPVLVRRFRLGTLIGTGLAAAAAGFAVCSLLDIDANLALVAIGGTLLGTGVGLADTLTNDTIVATVPVERAGGAAAISETAYELGGALGTAVLGSIGTAAYRSHLSSQSLDGLVPDEAVDAALDTLGSATVTAAQLPDDAANALLTAAQESFTYAITITFLIAAAVLLYGAIQAVLVLRTTATPRGSTPADTS